MPLRFPIVVFVFAWAAVCANLAAADDPASEEFFEKRVRPILAGTCFRCHGGGPKVGGQLRVDSREGLVKGGESGSAFDKDVPEKSLLLKAIRREDDVSAMPPDKALAEQQIADLTAWIKAGAPWPEKTPTFEAAKHWAFEPLAEAKAPAVKDQTWPRTSIDPFILAQLEAAGRKPSPVADRRTWLRRVTYDLTGLPPTAEEVAAFEKDDSPQAFETVVERLLNSKAYGEHWGRHWLDVVRYADTAGENSDHPLPHAWKYRNWVIDAFNRDLPYDEFLREQIAGDILAAQGPPELTGERIIATGYLAIARRFGHEIDKEMHLTLEDTLDTLGKSVLGLSLGCCRCHDHKFDPLSVEDYYGLYGIFESTKFPFPGCEPQQQPRDLVSLPMPAEMLAKIKEIDEQLAAVNGDINRLQTEQGEAAKKLQESAALAKALVSGEIDDAKEANIEAIERVAIQRGEALLVSIAPRGNHGADSTLVEFAIEGDGKKWSTAQLVPDLLAGNPHADGFGNEAVWSFFDLNGGVKLLPEALPETSGRKELQVWRNGDTPSVFVNRSEAAVKVWTELPQKSFFMHPGPQGPVGLLWTSPIDGEVVVRGRIADAHPGGSDGIAWKVEHLAADVGAAIDVLGKGRSELAVADKRQKELSAAKPVAPLAYAVREGDAHHARIHERGEPAELGDEVPRKFLDALGGYKLEDAPGSGRLQLAQWLTDAKNPLTPRVMVNRVWQKHFGRGLVATPNDFGTRGTPPTHPELLDHLATEFVRSGWKLKDLHRKIVLSATYRQAAGDAAATNLYGSFQRRRLSAEEIRDTLLVAGGDLDRTPAGPHPFPPEAGWNFTQHGPFAADYDTNKRSVYVMQKRNRRHRFFALFDGADPNTSTAVRDVTTVPTQALYFLNDPLVHAQANKLAARIFASAAEDKARVNFAYQQLLGRSASEAEQRDAADFLKEYVAALADRPEVERSLMAWQAYSRILLSSNEVLHVD